MIVEYLSFAVPFPAQPAFLAQDAAIWTPLLALSPADWVSALGAD